MQQHWLSHGGPRSPALRGVRGRADRKGGCCGARGAASGGARAERLGGRGLRSGRPPRNPGSGGTARPICALPPAVEKATRRGATATRQRGLYLARPEVKTGLSAGKCRRRRCLRAPRAETASAALETQTKREPGRNGGGSVSSGPSTGRQGVQVAGDPRTVRTSERGGGGG